MSQLAQETGAINLSQGFPDFPVSEVLIAKVNEHMKAGRNQYAPMGGVMTLREAIAGKVEQLYNITYKPDTEITITSGATQAIYTAITSCVREGDEVLLFTPAYDMYAPVIELNGGKPIYIQLKFPNYSIDWDEVKKLINHRTKMIVLNSPHNPTGSTLDAKDLEELEKITKDSDIIILSDEVYEHVIFDEKKHESIARYPDLAKRSFVVFSFGKTFHVTGWKTGYCLAPENLMEAFRKVHQFVVFSSNTAVQYALADYLRSGAHYEIAAFYQAKRDFFNKALEDSRFQLIPSSGTYFQLLDYSNITDEADVDFAKRLTKEIGVASIPVSVFYNGRSDDRVLRFCFAKSEDTLEQAVARLCEV